MSYPNERSPELIGEESRRLIFRALQAYSRELRSHAKTLRSVTEDTPIMTRRAAHIMADDHERTSDEIQDLHDDLQILDLFTKVRT